MEDLIWWGKQFLIGICSIFFLLLGIDTLIAAYHSNSPHVFIMCFFSSNLMILISAVGILYPIIKIYTRFRWERKDEGNNEIQK